MSAGPASDLVPYAAAMDRVVVAHSPLGQGLLTDGLAEVAPRPRGVRRASPLFRPGARRRLAPLNAALHEIAAAHGATPAQVALAWVVGHPNTIAIPGARTIAQLEENAAAADFVLAENELAHLAAEAAAFAERDRG
jgi:aryl-alcohol dehydrogenase-like predicted oxidoreductase